MLKPAISLAEVGVVISPGGVVVAEAPPVVQFGEAE